ncbi:hypothetical protein GJ496_005781 [Pomphorhynchus laevis]|nr:hypothetical protein GJ496_005781 [Pomphorhynchus laevis]
MFSYEVLLVRHDLDVVKRIEFSYFHKKTLSLQFSMKIKKLLKTNIQSQPDATTFVDPDSNKALTNQCHDENGKKPANHFETSLSTDVNELLHQTVKDISKRCSRRKRKRPRYLKDYVTLKGECNKQLIL